MQVNGWPMRYYIHLPIAFAEKVCSIYKIQMIAGNINVSGGFFYQFNITIMFICITTRVLENFHFNIIVVMRSLVINIYL